MFHCVLFGMALAWLVTFAGNRSRLNQHPRGPQPFLVENSREFGQVQHLHGALRFGVGPTVAWEAETITW